ncbi:MAG: hypothetical protein J6S85_14320 [Methanobrevibacter sp.]|nr:hypothetical protein [Methanobrevibacter sp.]
MMQGERTDDKNGLEIVVLDVDKSVINSIKTALPDFLVVEGAGRAVLVGVLPAELPFQLVDEVGDFLGGVDDFFAVHSLFSFLFGLGKEGERHFY